MSSTIRITQNNKTQDFNLATVASVVQIPAQAAPGTTEVPGSNRRYPKGAIEIFVQGEAQPWIILDTAAEVSAFYAAYYPFAYPAPAVAPAIPTLGA